jgi:two-component system, LytTR family, sensor kinase
MNDAPHSRLSFRELLLIFVFWTSLATLTAINQWLGPREFGMRVVSPAGPIAMAYVEAWLWAAVTPLIFRLSSRLSIDRSRWYVRVPLLVATGIVISLALYTILLVVRVEIFDVPRRGSIAFAPLRELGRFRFVNQLLLYFAVLAAGYAREYFLRDQERQRESIGLQARAARLQAQLADARLEALRGQINPHFLFNTLHAVAALVERDPPGVRRMIARLSDLLRRTIDSSGSELVPLREELELVQGYIDIMEVRFQGRLHVESHVDPETLDVPVPSLVLQPIVENALEHGASRALGEGRIEISARREGGNLLVTVRDNGPGVEAASESGVGLANTRARLHELYGDAAGLTLSSAPGGGAVAAIIIPIGRVDARVVLVPGVPEADLD